MTTQDIQTTKTTILVTGASSGLGKAFASALAANQQYTVYAAARRIEEMESLKRLGVIPLRMDITKDEEIQSVVTQIEQEQGGVDVLVNNAGLSGYGAVEDTAITDARNMFDVNLFGLARLTQLVLPSMRRKSAGKIINISSMGGRIYSPLGSWYHASKHALEGWSDCLRLETARFNIQVVLIEPGILRTKLKHGIMLSMLSRSGEGAYASLATALANKRQEKDSTGGAGSDPQIVVRLLLKIIRTKKPKTRYLIGKHAKVLVLLRKCLGDKIYDKIMLSVVEAM